MIIAIIFLIAVIVWAAHKIITSKEDRKLKGILRPWPVRQLSVDKFDARFKPGQLGPGKDTEIRFISCFRVEGGISDFESWILCNLAKSAKNIFEFGTCTGKTTYLLAANSPPAARITTLTLDPRTVGTYRAGHNDQASAKVSAMNESRFADFVYSGTPEEAKITQLFGDSKTFDETPYHGKFDLIFVDGSHAQSYVESDSRKALAMLERGGTILWHDYRGPRHTKGVFRALNELSKKLPLVHIEGTSFVALRIE
jgi:hypothetical protein